MTFYNKWRFVSCIRLGVVKYSFDRVLKAHKTLFNRGFVPSFLCQKKILGFILDAWQGTDIINIEDDTKIVG